MRLLRFAAVAVLVWNVADVCQTALGQEQVATSSTANSVLNLSNVLTLATRANEQSPLPNCIALNGKIQIQAGGRSETATIQAATRGLSQSYETISGPYTQSKLVYSNGEAALDGVASSLEFASSAQSPLFPAILLASIAADTNTAGKVIGFENIDGAILLHFQTLKNFPEMPDNYLAAFTQRDWWIEPATGLVRLLAFERREAGGATPSIRYEYRYRSFQNVSGILVPLKISQSVNGTPYAEITFSAPQINAGWTDQDFMIPEGN